jgi:dihydrofolate reductase
MKISVIVAIAKNNAIGKDNQLLWHLPADMKFFKEKTMGHHIVMGRKTYESIGKPLPGRTTVIVTRNEHYKAEGCIVVHSLKDALTIAKNANDNEVMITGGAELYKQAEPIADRIYLTEVKGHFDADTFFTFDRSNWISKEITEHKADEKNKFDYVFLVLEKKEL